MNNLLQSLIVSSTLAVLPALALAQVAAPAAPAAPAATTVAPAPSTISATAKTDSSVATLVSLSEGEIKKVDTQNSKLTIQHGPLTNLKMPGMTMAFKVKNPAMLQQVKPGDKVRMLIENLGGVLTVTTLQKHS